MAKGGEDVFRGTPSGRALDRGPAWEALRPVLLLCKPNRKVASRSVKAESTVHSHTLTCLAGGPLSISIRCHLISLKGG